MRLAFDTNVLVYAEGVLRAPQDALKHDLALGLVNAAKDEPIVLAEQALAELHSVLMRKARLTAAEATTRVRRWADLADVVPTDTKLIDLAMSVTVGIGLHIFDAIILAAAATADCEMLFSEDLQDGFLWRGVAVVNPFGPAPERRLARLLAR